MDTLDGKLIAALRADGRASLSTLAATLGVTRATVRTRLERLENSGVIQGYTVVTSAGDTQASVTGILTIALAGNAIERVVGRLKSLPGISNIYTTSGTWDIVVEFGVADLAELDDLLVRVRQFEGVVKSETSIYLRNRQRK